MRTTESVAWRGLRFEIVEYDVGHWAERHAHSIDFLDLVLSGGRTGRWEGGDVRMAPGTLALMPAGEAHAIASISPTRTFQVVIDPSRSDLAEARRSLAGPCASLGPGPVAWGVTQMWAEFRRRDDLTPLVLEGRLLRFLDGLASVAPGIERAAPWLRRAHDYVRAHAREGFAVSTLAAEVGVDPAHLMRSYARRYGATLGDDVRRHRVAHACRLLSQTEPSLGEVALTTGFADQSHLNRVFKRLTGLTPREFRETSLGR